MKIKKYVINLLLLSFLNIALFGCETENSAKNLKNNSNSILDDSDLVSETFTGKADTGYLSNIAFELEGKIESTIYINMNDYYANAPYYLEELYHYSDDCYYNPGACAQNNNSGSNNYSYNTNNNSNTENNYTNTENNYYNTENNSSNTENSYYNTENNTDENIDNSTDFPPPPEPENNTDYCAENPNSCANNIDNNIDNNTNNYTNSENNYYNTENNSSNTDVFDPSTLTPEQKARILEQVVFENGDMQYIINDQIAFAKNQINSSLIHINLNATDIQILEFGYGESDEIAFIKYNAVMETMVAKAELEEQGIDINSIMGKDYPSLLPGIPSYMFEQIGTACVIDGHDDVEYHNYFYYSDFNKPGCKEAMENAGIPIVNANLFVSNLSSPKNVYPEYDKLTEDGKIDVVIFFGAANGDWQPGDWDWGTYGRTNLVRDLTNKGFSKTAVDKGDLYRREKSGLQENIHIIGPELLSDLNGESDFNLFSELVRKNEIIVYNGHSFYGSLDMLDDPSIYPGKYQIFFMNSCWSYEYYTKQIFKHNVTENDPEGWLMADVVNDTESGWFHNMSTETRILLTNLLHGAESGGIDGRRIFTWDKIIEAMNKHALEEYKRKDTASHEIYGVSGVRTNQYRP